MTNWLWLEKRKIYLNTALVSGVQVNTYASGIEVQVFCAGNNEPDYILIGPDAEQIIEYLKRNAYH